MKLKKEQLELAIYETLNNLDYALSNEEIKFATEDFFNQLNLK